MPTLENSVFAQTSILFIYITLAFSCQSLSSFLDVPARTTQSQIEVRYNSYSVFKKLKLTFYTYTKLSGFLL